MGEKGQVGRGFDYGFGLGVEHDLDVVAVAEAELFAVYDEFAVSAVADENTAHAGAKDNFTVLTLVDFALGNLILQIQFGPLAVPN